MAWLLVLVLFHVLSAAEAVKGKKIAKPGCQEKCAAVEIPYPFGIGSNCSFHGGFRLHCNKTSRGNMVLFHGNVEVLNITISKAQARLYNEISWHCYNLTSNKTRPSTWRLSLNHTVYMISNRDNMFTVIGCETLAFNKMWNANHNFTYLTGCVSTCYDKGSLTDGSCSGNGCCQTSIPSGINYYRILFNKTIINSSRVSNVHQCGYAVIMATDSFKFSTSYIFTNDFRLGHNGTVPIVLDWSIGNETCEAAQANMSSYACVSSNSVCCNSINGQGYVCNCSSGYEGNPYLLDGCQDINECEDKSICSGICINTVGSYHCICPQGTQGDPTRNGKCYTVDSQTLSKSAKMALGFSSSLLSLLCCIFLIHILYERRRLASTRKKYFQQYGGRVLFEEIKWNHSNSFTFFTEKELKEATNNYHKSNLLGQGGNGTVYKGTVKSNEDVAIKKCMIIDEKNKKEFGKEILILSKINHINIVRILGCCLEVEIPILVYQFIPNGTLFDLLHCACHLSLSIRLRIAQEAAEALAYLHSWASPPIVHCDVKSANILLDENYVVKVSDFGASSLAKSDEDVFLTMVQGTRGYLDPECMQTGQLTVKSDVYSFGVVLLELLTRRKPFYLEGPEEERCLSSYFLTAMKENKLEEILDDQILAEENMNLIKEFAELARECLHMEGVQRPEMREVAERLGKLRKIGTHALRQETHDEIESLRVASSSNLESEIISCRSLEEKPMLVMEIGR